MINANGGAEYSVVFDNNEELYISKIMKNFDEYLQREIREVNLNNYRKFRNRTRVAVN